MLYDFFKISNSPLKSDNNTEIMFNYIFKRKVMANSLFQSAEKWQFALGTLP